jgi:ABC-type nitrate/sulfonate/bicarbonate transport system substrate-binding protein
LRTKRWALALLPPLITLALIGAAPLPAQELRPVRAIMLVEDAATLAARRLGMFAAEGLDVEVVITSSALAQTRALIDGSAQFAFSGFDGVLVRSGTDGVEIEAVAQIETGVLLTLFAQPTIRTWEDLRGQELAVDEVDTAYALVLRRMLLEHGLDLERGDYTLARVGSTRQRLEALLSGNALAALLNPPEDALARAAGLTALGDHRTVAPQYPGSCIRVNRAWAEAHRDQVVSFLRGWMAGSRWVHANRETAINLVASEQNLARDAVAVL